MGGKWIAGCALACALHATRAGAQPASTAPADSSPPVRALFQSSDLVVLAGFTAATVAMFPMDRRIASAVRDPALVDNAGVARAARVIGFMGSPAPFLIGGAMYVAGRYGKVPRAAHLAVHTTEAIVVGLGVAGALKATLGRARPHVSPDTNPGDFRFLKGLSHDGYQAFPSAHATIAFSVASAVTAETSEWWPRSGWIIGPALYGGATLVGLSRMYEHKHWASDVVMGAAIGVFSGLKTVRFNHTREGNRLDRWLLGDGADDGLQLRVGVAPGGGVGFLASSRW
ncbi:MAG: phosphatase PAP2 family protein [Gemmatimonadaceae bacterium]